MNKAFGKSLAKTRKMQRELKRQKSSFVFGIYNLETGEKLDTKTFWGFDSEEAFCNAVAWGCRQFAIEVHAEEE